MQVALWASNTRITLLMVRIWPRMSAIWNRGGSCTLLRKSWDGGRIDSVCFPETMNNTLVINAPRFFSLTWNIIKGWIDPRTAGKIELISSRKSWEARLRELVDVDQLPSDYGWKGMATTETLAKDAPEGVLKQHHDLVHVRASGHSTVEVPAGGSLHVTVFCFALSLK